MTREHQIKQAAVILPYRAGKVLMQLRDEKEGIVYPGTWGFFGGMIELGETPLECSRRELYEEIACSPVEMYPLSVDRVNVPMETILHSFYCHLPIPLGALSLHEGYDCNLFSCAEIESKRLYSPKADRIFPVISHQIITELAEKLFKIILTS